MIEQTISRLIQYALEKELIQAQDKVYFTNILLDMFGIAEYEEQDVRTEQENLEDTLAKLCDYAYEHGQLKENSVTYRDLFDTKIMGVLTPRPSEVIKRFYELYAEDKKAATEYFYRLCMDSDYIRRYRIAKDKKWVTSTEYGDLDITINLSKPEKDPKAIAAAKLSKATGYPKCQLCIENVGFAGHMNHPARQNLRIIPIELTKEAWGLQYSPYVYYNEHCIVLNSKHTPMTIEKVTFDKLLEFVTLFPHYFVGSNADLPIVGGSILTHEHFQGGNYTFAMAKAEVEKSVVFRGYEDISAGIVKWPMSVIRLCGKDVKRLSSLADKILTAWRAYSDPSVFIHAFSDEAGNFTKQFVHGGQRHNTITPIARRKGEDYELDLVLRNNVTTKEHPLGVYHPHAELHHIKKENIGLIEVMGLAVLPARLSKEMELVKQHILEGSSLLEDELTKKHAEWVESFRKEYTAINCENIDSILQAEIGKVFAKVLEHAGVYKRDTEGMNAFLHFVDTVNQ